MLTIGKKQVSFPTVLTLGFVFLILVGSLLLWLPISAANGQVTHYSDALFVSTSAVCVTGLSTVTTATHWSFFGQVVLAGLMEVGGLGFMTFAVMLSLLIRRRMRMATQLLTQEALNLNHISQLRVVYLIIRLSLGIQLTGVFLLALDLVPKYGWGKGLWYSLFHAVAAYCNAGFDLFGDSFNSLAGDSYLLLVISLLIMAGSFGFLVWQDLFYYHKRKRLSLHTKLALTVGGVITVGSIVIFYFTENNMAHLHGLNWFQRFVNTIFLAVTPRTAGFTSLPYTHLSVAGITLTIVLMFIGGSPGSTAGGIKTTTIGIVALQTWATLRGQREATFAHRRFTMQNVFRALTLLFIAIVIITIAVLLLEVTQTLPKHDGITTVVFEAVSAFGTVGITLDFTSKLNLVGKFIIMALMFIGRVGIYTVMYTVFNVKPRQKPYRYPEESVLIG